MKNFYGITVVTKQEKLCYPVVISSPIHKGIRFFMNLDAAMLYIESEQQEHAKLNIALPFKPDIDGDFLEIISSVVFNDDIALSENGKTYSRLLFGENYKPV